MDRVDGDAPRELVTKAEFARRVKRSPGRVSQWIGEGKISGPALVDDAGTQKIDLAVAVRQLGLSLDIGQQAAQPHPVPTTVVPLRVASSTPSLPGPLGRAAADRPAPPPPAPPEDSDEDSDQKRLRKAKADSAEHDAEEKRRARLAENGKWLRAEEARLGWMRSLGSMLTVLEAEFVNMAEVLAAVPRGDKRAMQLAIRAEFRKVRQKIAATSRAHSETLPVEAEQQHDEPELVDA